MNLIKHFPLRAVLGTIGLSAATLSTPAMAARGIVYDNYPLAVTVCSVGMPCSGDTISNLDYSPAILFGQIYIYSQGIVSFDAELPGTDPTTFGGTSYLAPGYSANANYDVSAVMTDSYGDGSRGLVINFSDTGSSSIKFQIAMISFNYGAQEIVDFFYPGGDPAANALVGYNLLDFGASNTATNNILDFDKSKNRVTLDFDTDTATDGYDFVYQQSVTPVLPEPASWAMMTAGLGLLGGIMRRKARQARFA